MALISSRQCLAYISEIDNSTPSFKLAITIKCIDLEASPQLLYINVAMETFSGPKLNVVIMVIGSQGDVQHFLTIGNILKAKYGHRVRIATHPVFRKLVQERDLEFFSVGGDPAEMVAFRIANPGLSAMLTKIRSGQIRQLRDSMLGIFQGYWRACVEDRDHVEGSSSQNPFVADAIIASYPCYAHIHCAERLGIPLHLMFTASRTPTKAIPHTQSLWQSNVDTSFTNLLSYYISELMYISHAPSYTCMIMS